VKEFFVIGWICIFNPVLGQDHCAFMTEQPVKFYRQDECEVAALKKVNEIGVELTKQGLVISRLQMWCTVDKTKLNT
jgi:hypothetical protein